MSQRAANVRVRRTQKLLREALIELIEERGFEALTVGEITERALVSRAAFYRNYQDKYDLVEQIFAEAMQALLEAVSKPETAHSPESWVRFFEHIADYDRLYRALLGRKGSPWFVLKMRAALLDLLKEFERFSMAGRPVYPAAYAFVPDLLAAMLLEAITWWLEHDQPHPPAEMANRTMLLAGAVLKETSTWE